MIYSDKIASLLIDAMRDGNTRVTARLNRDGMKYTLIEGTPDIPVVTTILMNRCSGGDFTSGMCCHCERKPCPFNY